MLEAEHLKVISDSSDKLVALSLRYEKEEKDRRHQANLTLKEHRKKKDELNAISTQKQKSADKQVI